MHRFDALGIAVNIAAVAILIASVGFAMVMYREPVPEVAEVPTVRVVTFAAAETDTPTATLTPTRLAFTRTRDFTPTAVITRTVTRPANCVPLPALNAGVALNPPAGSPSLTPSATRTPFLVAHMIDLDPNVLQTDKYLLIIFRCSGIWDEYWLADQNEFPGKMAMQPGDVAYQWIAPANLKPSATPTRTPTRPVRPTATATNTPTP
jgi:hypothetical protein